MESVPIVVGASEAGPRPRMLPGSRRNTPNSLTSKLFPAWPNQPPRVSQKHARRSDFCHLTDKKPPVRRPWNGYGCRESFLSFRFEVAPLRREVKPLVWGSRPRNEYIWGRFLFKCECSHVACLPSPGGVCSINHRAAHGFYRWRERPLRSRLLQ